MASYHRTQILLEKWQATLKGLSEREGVSMSDLVRRILSQRLRSQPSRQKRLATIAGIGRDRRAAGRDHDRWLYGSGSAS